MNNIIPNDLDPLHYGAPGSTVFEFKNITHPELKGVLMRTKVCKSSGLDRISNKLLKAAGNTIIDSLVNIFNVSLSTGIFPDKMKHAKVTPIYKSGEKIDCSNYRPISVISAVAKMFEQIVYNQLNYFLNENTIISTHQSGFRTRHSTETTLMILEI